MNAKRILLGIGGGGMALFALVVGVRTGTPAPELRRPPKATASMMRAEPDLIAVVEPALFDPEPILWESLPSLIGDDASDRERRRSDLLDRTAEFLGLQGSQAQSFTVVARQVVADVDWAWCARDAAVLRSSGDSSEEEAAQEEYETRKKWALARVDAFVGEGPRAEEFRSRLDEWIDALR